MPERNHAQTDADLFNSPAVSTHDVSVLSQNSCHKLSPTPPVRLLQIKQHIVLMRFINLVLMDPCIVDYSVEIPTRCSFVIEFIIPKFIEGSTCFERYTAHHQEL
jgi:hypothetical protein